MKILKHLSIEIVPSKIINDQIQKFGGGEGLLLNFFSTNDRPLTNTPRYHWPFLGSLYNTLPFWDQKAEISRPGQAGSFWRVYHLWGFQKPPTFVGPWPLPQSILTFVILVLLPLSAFSTPGSAG